MPDTQIDKPEKREKIQRKYQVFISSTFSDLEEHRRQAILGIVAAGHLPLALEYRAPEPSMKMDVIRRAIGDCQYYVIILGHRYGSVASGQIPGQEKSYIEFELDYAEQMGLKILAFVLRDEEANGRRKKMTLESDPGELENNPKYERFRKRLTEGIQGYFYRPFLSPNDIYTELYAYFSQDHPDVRGYIPEPVDRDAANFIRISSNNEILRETIQHLGQFKFVDPRLSMAREKKLALAKAFCQLHRNHIREKWKKIFIESGSTLAYLAKEISGDLPKTRDDHKVVTNNSLAYLYLWLCSGVLCHPEPEGPPDSKYGGMFGSLTDRDRAPDYNLPHLEQYDGDGEKLISDMKATIFGATDDNKYSILLAAASGLQLSDKITPLDPDGKPYTGDPAILELLKQCDGFHGGSYQNRLFKRCMYLSNIPAFVFMHDEKIDCPIRVGICHFLFDEGHSWKQFIENYPLSIWIACESTTVREIREKMVKNLRLGDWKVAVYSEASRIPIIIAHNASFRSVCQEIGVTVYGPR
jgi:hypothetical protein